MKTLWCKNQENPSDRISHAWAPLNCVNKYTVCTHILLYTVCKGGGGMGFWASDR
jgi:hypothetical protein